MSSELPSLNMSSRQADPSGLRTSRTPRSVEHFQKTQLPMTLTYAERFHYITKISNYNEMHDTAIWRQYEKLRDCLKTLNEQILAEMQKRTSNMRKPEQPKSKSQQEVMRLLQEEWLMNDVLVKGKKDELASIENRMKLITKAGIREELQIECQTIKEMIVKIKVENKDSLRKTKLLGRDLVSAPQLLVDKLMILEEDLILADRKVYKIRKRATESDAAVSESFDKFNQITKAIISRQEQYKFVDKFVEEQIQLDNYDELKNKRDNLKKYESPLKRNYLTKLKDLDQLISNVNHHDKVISESEKSVIAIRTQIESIGAILGARRPSVTQQKQHKPHRYQQASQTKNSGKRHTSMMEIRQTITDDKNQTTQGDVPC